MTLAYLVDTDWAVHWLHGHQRIRQRMEELRGRGLALSAVSLAELWEGVLLPRSAAKRTWSERFLEARFLCQHR